MISSIFMDSWRESFAKYNTILADYKEINFDTRNSKFKEIKTKQKQLNTQKPIPILKITNKLHLKTKIEEFMDFDIIDLETIYLITFPCENSIFLYSFSKKDKKLQHERKFTFETKKEIDVKENIFAVSFGTLLNEEIVLACGGSMGFVYIIYIEEEEPIQKELDSNNGDVYTLAFPPKISTFKSDLLLVGYKNGCIILWNIQECQMIVEFRNYNQCPPSDVSSVDWHSSGQIIVASYLDTRIMIWEIDEEILNLINPIQKDPKRKILTKSVPLIETFDGHSNYVDCVKFWGNFIVSRDCEGNILVWVPYKETLFLINVYEFEYYEAIWYIKFSIHQRLQRLCLGNDNGEIFVYKLSPGNFVDQEDKNRNSSKKYFDLQKTKCEFAFELDNEKKIIRKAIITEDEKYLFCISDGGKIWWKNIEIK